MAKDWSLLSTHGRTLVVLARRPTLRLREVAGELGITPRAVQDVVADLERAGFLERHREGRRNRYVVRGDAPMHDPVSGSHEAADLFQALGVAPRVPPRSGPRRAIVLACSDHRYQEPLRDLLAAEGLLGRSELLAWPGGSSALAGPDAGRLIEAMALAGGAAPSRIVLVAHQDCRVPGAHVRAGTDAFRTRRAVTGRRRRATERIRRRFGVEPELWFLDRSGARPVRSRTASPIAAPTSDRAAAGR